MPIDPIKQLLQNKKFQQVKKRKKNMFPIELKFFDKIVIKNVQNELLHKHIFLRLTVFPIKWHSRNPSQLQLVEL